MKAHVYVTLKKTVLDPQGQAIHNALRKMRYAGVVDVRQASFSSSPSTTRSRTRRPAEVERIAREVLTNPVIEEFSFRLD